MRIFSQGEALDTYDFLCGFTLMATIPEIDIAVLQETVFFGSLSEDMFDELVAQSHVVTLDVGQILFQEGEAATAFYAVLEGLVKLTMGRPDGREVMVEMFHKGSSFAEALVFSDAILSRVGLDDCRKPGTGRSHPGCAANAEDDPG